MPSYRGKSGPRVERPNENSCRLGRLGQSRAGVIPERAILDSSSKDLAGGLAAQKRSAMSHMTVCVDNSLPPKERRIRVRHPLGALAYLDIGADNGGIILNVSEEGLALQAAGPLDQQKEISLRIQLPRSEKPIETAARIVWLGQSNRQAGVRFLAMPAAARAQIQEWMRSAPAPGSSENPHT